VTKQQAAKWPYIANAVFRIVQNYGYFADFSEALTPRGSSPFMHCVSAVTAPFCCDRKSRHILTLRAVQVYNLSSKFPMKTNQMHYLASSRT